MDPNSKQYETNEQSMSYRSQEILESYNLYNEDLENQYQINKTSYFMPPSSTNTGYHYGIPQSQMMQNQSTSYGIEKPWTRAMKDPSIIQRGTEIFVGNLSMDTFENDIYEAFRDCGDIIDIRLHKNVQTKKCYAFVRFVHKDMIRAALNKNFTNLKGRKMKITKSNENSTIFIGNIRKNWTNSDVEIKVKRIFNNCEKVEHFADPNNPSKNRGFCFVVFKNRNEAIKALNYVASKGGINIDGVPLTCDWADVVDEDDSNSLQIFVSGLDENLEENIVREVFSVYGQVSIS